MKKTSNLWRYVFLVFLCILLYQFKSTWDTDTDFKKTKENIPADSVIFLTIEEKEYGADKRGFDSLIESLHTWEHDEKEKKVKFKFDSYLPSEHSKLIFVYEKEYTTFEQYADVVSLSTFPYEYRFKEKSLLEVHHVDKEGNLYFLFKGKKIQLKPGQSYQTFGFSNFRLTRTKIENNGFYKKENFSLIDTKKQD